MARNQRLYEAIRQSGMRLADIADAVGSDPKTIQRWIATGRIPRPPARQKTAEVLGVPVSILWPDAPGATHGVSELVGVYTSRKELPPKTVASLLDSAREHVDILAYSGMWLWDSVPDFASRLADKVKNGTEVRVCLGDPDSEGVKLRGTEEGSGEGMAARCRIAIGYANVIIEADNGAVRKTGATLYASLLRFDDDVFVNSHFWGHPAGDSPVYHLRRRGDDGIAATALRSFGLVWDGAQSVSAG